jgi:hypothetical protein
VEYRNGHGYGGRYIPPEAIRAPAGTPARLIPPVVEAQGHAAQGVFPDGEVIALIAAYTTGQRRLFWPS